MTAPAYYHGVGNNEKRNASIDTVARMMPDNMTLLDIFDDFYDFMLILLDADADEAFWKMIDILEPMVKSFKIINLQTKIISIKMKYYRKHNRNADYLRAAGLFYEMTKIMEKETMKKK